MHHVLEFLASNKEWPSRDQAASLATQLETLGLGTIYPRSVVAREGTLYFLSRGPHERTLGILSREKTPPGFDGKVHELPSSGLKLVVCPASSGNAAGLRAALPWLRPRLLGLLPSFGFGDRLGLATPGHIRALRGARPAGCVRPAAVLAQQSMRENERTGRSPQDVVDDAAWGAFAEGWSEGFGADADHLKRPEDIPACVEAGYTMYTVDPGDHVDNRADQYGENELRERVDALPWIILSSSPADLVGRLAGRRYDLGHRPVQTSEESILRAAVRYGGAVAHTVTMYRRLEELAPNAFELEVSVDETDSVTGLVDHIYVAEELSRLGVSWVSLAPRFYGRFEKGVDFQPFPGEESAAALKEFRRTFRDHVGVARKLGPYKLSLHSGSDKFSVYPLVAEAAGELVHVKTAGTSYLEALRAAALHAPGLFSEIVALSRDRYAEDRASYHVSASLDAVPDLSKENPGGLLEDFHARQVLHVTYGSILKKARLRKRLMDFLWESQEAYFEVLEVHFRKHLVPFVG